MSLVVQPCIEKSWRVTKKKWSLVRSDASSQQNSRWLSDNALCIWGINNRKNRGQRLRFGVGTSRKKMHLRDLFANWTTELVLHEMSVAPAQTNSTIAVYIQLIQYAVGCMRSLLLVVQQLHKDNRSLWTRARPVRHQRQKLSPTGSSWFKSHRM